MDSCGVKGLMPLEQALTAMQSSLSNVCEAITLPLSQALGFALAQDIKSPLNVPPFNNSTMDGYALNQADLINCSPENTVTLKMCGKSFAGAPYEGELPSGCCLRIMTGAVMPSCADTVVMQERTQANGEAIRFSHFPKLANNVRLAGEDIKQGQVVLHQGHKLTARDIPLMWLSQVAEYRLARPILSKRYWPSWALSVFGSWQSNSVNLSLLENCQTVCFSACQVIRFPLWSLFINLLYLLSLPWAD